MSATRVATNLAGCTQSLRRAARPLRAYRDKVLVSPRPPLPLFFPRPLALGGPQGEVQGYDIKVSVMGRDEKLWGMSKRKAYLSSCVAKGRTQTGDGLNLQTELDQKVAYIAENKQVDEYVLIWISRF